MDNIWILFQDRVGVLIFTKFSSNYLLPPTIQTISRSLFVGNLQIWRMALYKCHDEHFEIIFTGLKRRGSIETVSW